MVGAPDSCVPWAQLMHHAATDVNRYRLRSLQLRLLARRPQLPGTALRSTSCLCDGQLTIRKVEYAQKAVENGGTAIGIRCKDGVVLALEKIISSKLLKKGANKRIASVDRNMGIVRWLTHPPSHTGKLTATLTGLLRPRS